MQPMEPVLDYDPNNRPQFPLLILLPLALVVGIIAYCVDRSSPPTPPPVEHVEWSISVRDGDLVTLRGVLPDGRPTETYLDHVLLDRDPDGAFVWDLEAELPETVALIGAMDDCEAIIAEAASWTDQTDDSDPRDVQYLQLAYAAAAMERGAELGCE
jgi:hypothetical protein